MRTINLAPLALMAMLLTTASCKKEPDPPPTVHPPAPIDPFIKSIAYFEPGSYWVYEDSATGRLDSNWVIRSSIQWLDQPEPYNDNQQLDTDFRSSLGYPWYFNAHSSAWHRDPPYYNGVERSAWQAANNIFLWPFDSTINISYHYSLTDSVTLNRVIDSVTLPFGTIGPVYEVKLGPQGQTRYLYATFWFCPGYGIVRQEFHEEKNWPIQLGNTDAERIMGDWKLIRAHIIQ